jgi:hypothetical protein
MTRVFTRLAPLAVLLVALTGCAADPALGPGSAASTPSPEASALPATPTTDVPATTGPTGRSPAAAPRVVLRRSGGFAGQDDTITVEPDGRWTAVDRAGTRRTGRLAAADLDRLRRLAIDPGLANTPAPVKGVHCADALAYRLTVGGITVDWFDCPAVGTPPEAASALATLLLEATG